MCDVVHNAGSPSHERYALLTLTPSLLKSAISSYERTWMCMFHFVKGQQDNITQCLMLFSFYLSCHLSRGQLDFWSWLCLLSTVCTLFTCSLSFLSLFSCFSEVGWLKCFVPIYKYFVVIICLELDYFLQPLFCEHTLCTVGGEIPKVIT